MNQDILSGDNVAEELGHLILIHGHVRSQSGHNVYSGAGAELLIQQLGDDTGIGIAPGVIRGNHQYLFYTGPLLQKPIQLRF